MSSSVAQSVDGAEVPYEARSERLIGGACADLARHLGVHVAFVRSIACLLALASWCTLLVYPLLCWVARARSPRARAARWGARLRRQPGPTYLALTFAAIGTLALNLEPLATVATYARGLAPADPVASEKSAEALEPVRDLGESDTSSTPAQLAMAQPQGELLATELQRIVTAADLAEIRALRTREPSWLDGFYAGDARAALVESIRHSDASLEEIHALEGQTFQAVRLRSEVQAEVDAVERWSSAAYDRRSGACRWYVPSHSTPQTIHLERKPDGWKIVRIDFGEASLPERRPCQPARREVSP